MARDEDGDQLGPVALSLPSQPTGTADSAANGRPNDLAHQMSAEDFAGCCSTLMRDMKLTKQTDLLPLVVGLLQHIGNAEFAQGRAKKRSGAFSKSVKAADEGEKVEEIEAFRRLRRAALSSDARHLLQQELSSKELDLQQVDEEEIQELEPTLLRYGFLAGRPGVDDALKVLSEQRDVVVNEHVAQDEPCGF